MNCLIIGGSKSGKSDFGENMALNLNKGKVIYIATMKPYDKEDENRIEVHIKNREGRNFTTIEKFLDIHEVADKINNVDTVLIDSITSLLTNEMFIGDKIIKNPSNKILNGLKTIINKAENTVVVSDYIFNDCIEYDKITENFKRELGIINKSLTNICHKVVECSFGNVRYHK